MFNIVIILLLGFEINHAVGVTPISTACKFPNVTEGVRIECFKNGGNTPATCSNLNDASNFVPIGSQIVFKCQSGYKYLRNNQSAGNIRESMTMTCGLTGHWIHHSIENKIFQCSRAIKDMKKTKRQNNRVKRAYGTCNGGTGRYVTYTNTNMNNVYSHIAAGCFHDLRDTMVDNNDNNVRWGCFSIDWGRCKCTADSSYIWSYVLTFDEALSNMKRHSKDFKSIEAETHEGNMYITYTCYFD